MRGRMRWGDSNVELPVQKEGTAIPQAEGRANEVLSHVPSCGSNLWVELSFSSGSISPRRRYGRLKRVKLPTGLRRPLTSLVSLVKRTSLYGSVAFYALERITKDSPKDHGQIMEVLTAYVRDNAPWPPKNAWPLKDAITRLLGPSAATVLLGQD